MATRADEAETKELRSRAKRYVLDVRLADGEELRAPAGSDVEAARAQLASIHATGTSDAFVSLGENTVVRGRDIRYVRLLEDDEENERGLIESLKERVGGSHRMTTHDSEQGLRTTRIRGSGGESGGFFDEPAAGYGRRPWAETKPFFLTSEFLVLAAIVLGLAIAMGVLDTFNASRGWLLITIIGAAYMVSRGLAKAGTRDPNPRDGGHD
ncbi:MAG: hypothetical protein M3327_08920 [Actinomycetota bacterium]|nr:hypothetical protein [Actinomycetota bacterium]